MTKETQRGAHVGLFGFSSIVYAQGFPDTEDPSIGRDYSESLLELDHREGRGYREGMIRCFERIERLLVYTDEMKEFINSGFENNYFYFYLDKSKVHEFEDNIIWKGFTLSNFEYNKAIDPEKDTVIASATNFQRFSENVPQAQFPELYEQIMKMTNMMSLSTRWEFIKKPEKASLREPETLCDIFTHEIIHGLGIIPAREINGYPGLQQRTIVGDWEPASDDGKGFSLNAGGDTLFFAGGNRYEHAYNKYNEYRDKASEIYDERWDNITNIDDTSGTQFEVNFDPDDGLVPYENTGGAGTASGHIEQLGYRDNTGLPGANTKFYLGILNELMVGYVRDGNISRGVISGITLGVAKSLTEDGKNIFRILREDGEILPMTTTTEEDGTKSFNFTQEDINTIPWNKGGDQPNQMTTNWIPLQVCRIVEGNTIIGYALLLNYNTNQEFSDQIFFTSGEPITISEGDITSDNINSIKLDCFENLELTLL